MTIRSGQGWQVILADLSLILFIVIASGFVTGEGSEVRTEKAPMVAEATELWRPASEKTFSDWLRSRSGDPRETVTINARYTADQRDRMADQAIAALAQAQAAGFAPRVILEQGMENDLFATVSFVGSGQVAHDLHGASADHEDGTMETSHAEQS